MKKTIIALFLVIVGITKLTAQTPATYSFLEYPPTMVEVRLDQAGKYDFSTMVLTDTVAVIIDLIEKLDVKSEENRKLSYDYEAQKKELIKVKKQLAYYKAISKPKKK